MTAGRWDELRERTRQNRKDKQFWDQLMVDVLTNPPKKKRGHPLERRYEI